MKVALDSNLLCYLANILKVADDGRKRDAVDNLINQFSSDVHLAIPYQVFGECYHVMVRYGFTRQECQSIIADWAQKFEPLPSTETAFLAALDLATDHKLQFWDALIICVAAEAGCSLLLSEDLQDGFGWHGLTVVNPFSTPLDRRLSRLLTD